MKIAVIPDVQMKPDVPTEHLHWIAQYIIDKKPDHLVMIGDWWDMPSLSSYDKGKKSFEGRRYRKDIAAGNEAMEMLLDPIKKEEKRLVKNKKKKWRLEKTFTLGNHEQRIERVAETQPELDGVVGYNDLFLDDWEVMPFLEPKVIEQVAFAHYFTSGPMGRPVSSASALLRKKMMSAVMGHVQDKDIASGKRADGRRLTALFAGICYLHDEDYLGAQGNNSWRGIWMLNEVKDGSFDEMPVSLNFLRERYGVV